MRMRLTARGVATAGEGWHFDGDGSGLALRVRGGGRSWVLRVRMDGRQRDIGLGSWPDLSLADARRKAAEMRRAIAEGRDPVAERRAARAVPTLAEALDRWIAKEAGGWKGGMQGHTARVTPGLFARHLPGLMDRRVNRIDEKAIVAALAPVWIERQETARKLLERLRATLRLAKAHGHCAGLDWDEVREALPSVRAEVQHHAMFPLDTLPGFMRRLETRDGIAAKALRFTILTACRSGEVRGARWEEIDWQARVWRIPASRMKAGKPHEVPLSGAAMALLREVQAEADILRPGCPLIFPGPTGRPVSDPIVGRLAREGGGTAHGARASFRSWCGEAGIDRETAEMALAHAPAGGAVEAAYRRTSALERRRAVMERWAAYCMGERGQVVPFRLS